MAQAISTKKPICHLWSSNYKGFVGQLIWWSRIQKLEFKNIEAYRSWFALALLSILILVISYLKHHRNCDLQSWSTLEFQIMINKSSYITFLILGNYNWSCNLWLGLSLISRGWKSRWNTSGELHLGYVTYTVDMKWNLHWNFELWLPLVVQFCTHGPNI